MTPTRPLSVLIVEDNPDAADSLAVLVEMYDHRPRVAHSGEEAVRAAREQFPDVVLLDIGLPDADGYAVAGRVCELSDRRPLLVMLTGHQHTEARSRAAGIDHHFLKPIDPAALEDLLRRHAESLAPAG
jgi:two-component system CheB/CheR fusion protein